MGIKPLKLVNQALLGKWLWRLREEGDSLWFKVVAAKYGVSRGGWDLGGPSYHFFGLWRGIMSVKNSFETNIKFRLEDGKRLFFWLDCWAGDTSFATQFPSLFACARDREAKACDYMVRNGDYTLWGPIFRRDVSVAKEEELCFSLGGS